MIRRALIIYCDNTYSGKLPGPIKDEENYTKFLTSYLGGEWYAGEIRSLNNPTKLRIEETIQKFLNGADYTFIIFSGHGCINQLDNNLQYFEVADGNISIRKLITDAKRQTIIADSCRGFEKFISEEMTKAILETKMFSTGLSTRNLFNSEVLSAEAGLSILYSSSEDQSAIDSENGGVYLLSLLAIAKEWGNRYSNEFSIDLKTVHNLTIEYLNQNFNTIQVPVIEPEKRTKYFPFAVKNKSLI